MMYQRLLRENLILSGYKDCGLEIYPDRYSILSGA